MFCMNCGYKLSNKKNICVNCGASVDSQERCGGFWNLTVDDNTVKTNRLVEIWKKEETKNTIIVVLLVFIILIMVFHIKYMSGINKRLDELNRKYEIISEYYKGEPQDIRGTPVDTERKFEHITEKQFDKEP